MRTRHCIPYCDISFFFHLKSSTKLWSTLYYIAESGTHDLAIPILATCDNYFAHRDRRVRNCAPRPSFKWEIPRQLFSRQVYIWQAGEYDFPYSGSVSAWQSRNNVNWNKADITSSCARARMFCPESAICAIFDPARATKWWSTNEDETTRLRSYLKRCTGCSI